MIGCHFVPCSANQNNYTIKVNHKYILYFTSDYCSIMLVPTMIQHMPSTTSVYSVSVYVVPNCHSTCSKGFREVRGLMIIIYLNVYDLVLIVSKRSSIRGFNTTESFAHEFLATAQLSILNEQAALK